MKILVLSNLYPPFYVGGYELHCRTVAEALQSRGHQILVLTSDHGLDRAEPPSSEANVIRSLKLHGFVGHPFLGILQLQDLEIHNNQVLVSTLRRFQPDVVYVWSMSGLSKSLLFTLQKRGVPTAFCICDYWLAKSERSDVWLNWWNRKITKSRHEFLRVLWTLSRRRRRWQEFAPTNPIRHLRPQRIHFCSRALREATAAEGFDVQDAAVIYCSVNTQKFNGAPRPANRPMQRLLFVGRLTEDKGLMTALRALTLVRDKFAGQLSVYGRGEPAYERKVIDLAQAEKLPVIFNDLLSPAQMPEVYRAHDALLFTSEWQEPFAITPLEAMACGLPVIGTTTGGSAELFRHGENAMTYTAGNAEELAQRIVELDSDNLLRERIARAGHDEIHRRFNEQAIVDQIECYLAETLKNWQPVTLPHYAA